MKKKLYTKPQIEVTSIGTILMAIDSTLNHDHGIGAPQRREIEPELPF